ncbi:hypothetical protein TrLO_g5119 [Triparma laevis f. longispina]|uniref:SSD domain-containing protein n=1 Tax=Triparma laevis f. longispina TaxID=1714387 RepID=A0A9W7DYH2_9STRA|nr:hypothetical protein TrLO_g5119 [Triparma laevis f. longispina]
MSIVPTNAPLPTSALNPANPNNMSHEIELKQSGFIPNPGAPLPVPSQNYVHAASEVPKVAPTFFADDKGNLKYFTYWIYEAQTSAGCFTADTLPVMEEAETMFTSNAEWQKWCLREYNDIYDATQGYECAKSLSALNAYKASSWDQVMVDDIEDRLDNPVAGVTPLADAVIATLPTGAFNGREVYQLLGFCTKFGVACDIMTNPAYPFAAFFTTDDINIMKAFSSQLDADFATVTALWDGSGAINSDPEAVSLFQAYMKDLPSQAFLVDFFFDAEFTKENPVTMFSRSITFWGAPVLGVTVDPDNEKDTKSGDARKKFVMDTFFEDMEKIANPGHNNKINAYYFMRVLILDVFLKILANDGMFALLSIAIVYFYMRFMLQSWFLANVGFLEIVLSIPTAWFFAEWLFQVDYFSSLNPLCLFIVAAIGADDIFVFMDAYKQSAYKGPAITRDLASRMSYVYRRAGTAMLITSATTCSAFLCTVASPIASTKSFGIFAALVILMDYILVMTMFCTAVVIYHNTFEHPSVNCCVQCACVCCCPCVPRIAAEETSTGKANAGKNDDGKQDRITEFYKGPFTNFVLNPTTRFASLFALFVWFCIAFYFMLQLEPTKKTEQFLSDDHPLQKAITILNEAFPIASDDRGAKMYFSWGVGEVDRSGVNQMFRDDFIGKPTFDDDFFLSQACQQKIYDYTQEVRVDAARKYDDYVKRDAAGMVAIVSWLDELKDWIEGGVDGVKAGEGSTLFGSQCVRNPMREGYSFPVSDADTKEALIRFAYEPSCSEDIPYPGALIMETYVEDSRATGLPGNMYGFNGEDLKSLSISLESSVLDPWSEIAETKAMEQYNFFVAEAAHIDTLMEAECGKVLMTDIDQKYIIMNNQKIFRTSAVSGAMIGCAIAFVVILVSTLNVFVAAFATLSILCVLVSVVGAVTIAGWTLGTITSILISILAGFSVDYVVHLAHAFVTTPGDKETRVRGAFADMGVSVMSGMLTSILASLPLFLCKIKFFASFGIFLCATIAFSWTYANLMFMGLLATFDVMKFSFGKGGKVEEGSGGIVKMG